MKKPVLAIDFDGTLRADENTPMKGALEAVRYYLLHFEVNVYAARSMRPGGIKYLRDWLRKHGFPVDKMKFPKGKPPIDALIDDQAYRFTGTWPSAARLVCEGRLPTESEIFSTMDKGYFCGLCGDTGWKSHDQADWACDQCELGEENEMARKKRWAERDAAKLRVLQKLSKEDVKALELDYFMEQAVKKKKQGRTAS